MKILYLGGESANWVVNLCNELCTLGHEVTCVTQGLDEYDSENPVDLHKNLKKINVDYKDFMVADRMKNKLIVTLTNEKFDIIVGSHAPVSTAVSELSKLLGIPYVIMLLDIPTDLMRTARFRTMTWFKWFESMKFADGIIFNTYVARDEYQKYTGQYFDDSYVIPYAINMPEEYDNSGIDIKGDYVLSVCRLTDIKNCGEIALALAHLEKPLKYIAVGRDRGALANMKEACGHYNIPFEHREMVTEKEKFELIKNCAMLIYPQQTEYIAGLSPLEAMYCGKPALVRNYKILRDLYGRHAVYYNNTAASLADTISIIRGIHKRIIKPKLEEANKYVKQIASFKLMATRMNDVLKKAVTIR